jgi:hypothetical protein
VKRPQSWMLGSLLSFTLAAAAGALSAAAAAEGDRPNHSREQDVSVLPDLGGFFRDGRWTPVTVVLSPGAHPSQDIVDIRLISGSAAFRVASVALAAPRTFKAALLPTYRDPAHIAHVEVQRRGDGRMLVDEDVSEQFRPLGIQDRLVLIVRPPVAASVISVQEKKIDSFDLQCLTLAPDRFPLRLRDLENVDAVIVDAEPPAAGPAGVAFPAMGADASRALEDWVEAGGCAVTPAGGFRGAAGFGRVIEAASGSKESQGRPAWEDRLAAHFAGNKHAAVDARTDPDAFQAPDRPGDGSPEGRSAGRTAIWAFALTLLLLLVFLYRRKRSRFVLSLVIFGVGLAAAVAAGFWTPQPSQGQTRLRMVRRSADGAAVLVTDLYRAVTFRRNARIQLSGLPDDARVLSADDSPQTTAEYAVDQEQGISLDIAMDQMRLIAGTRLERAVPGDSRAIIETAAAVYRTRAEIPAGLQDVLFVEKPDDASESVAWINRLPQSGCVRLADGDIKDTGTNSFIAAHYPETTASSRLMNYALKKYALRRPGARLAGLRPYSAGEAGGLRPYSTGEAGGALGMEIVMIELVREEKK